MPVHEDGLGGRVDNLLGEHDGVSVGVVHRGFIGSGFLEKLGKTDRALEHVGPIVRFGADRRNPQK